MYYLTEAKLMSRIGGGAGTLEQLLKSPIKLDSMSPGDSTNTTQKFFTFNDTSSSSSSSSNSKNTHTSSAASSNNNNNNNNSPSASSLVAAAIGLLNHHHLVENSSNSGGGAAAASFFGAGGGAGLHRLSLIADDLESVRSGSSSITTSSTASSGGSHNVGVTLPGSMMISGGGIVGGGNISGGGIGGGFTPCATSVAITAASSIDTCSNYDEDEMPPIEELGRDYLSRYNSIRRHTIATNEDNEMLGQSNNIMKSTECLLNFGQG